MAILLTSTGAKKANKLHLTGKTGHYDETYIDNGVLRARQAFFDGEIVNELNFSADLLEFGQSVKVQLVPDENSKVVDFHKLANTVNESSQWMLIAIKKYINAVFWSADIAPITVDEFCKQVNLARNRVVDFRTDIDKEVWRDSELVGHRFVF